ncbi:hypothetical protein PoB_003346000 [Plakobranchus ocellatus]|uniref:Uncharacterized protein n=1 Tax=Plakobranchus ocellatus TaxID=259542 RepID=A0AAV4AFL3_9GAST|nr:hypothetical protein PoB_003346000 [Plakobranchus ocellatus]
MRIRRDATESHNSCQPVKGIDPVTLKVFVHIACPQKMISSFQALRQARSPVTKLEFATQGSLQISGPLTTLYHVQSETVNHNCRSSSKALL